MLKLKIILSIQIFCFIGKAAVAQPTDIGMFQSFCNKIAEQNRHFSISKSLTGTFLAEDPVEGKTVVIYGEKSKALNDFKKNKVSTQIEILNTLDLPIFPLRDTVYIVDTLYSFSSLSYKVDGIVFMIERQVSERNTVSIFNLEHLWIRNSMFHLTLYNQGWQNKLDYSFEIVNNKFKATNFARLSPIPEF